MAEKLPDVPWGEGERDEALFEQIKSLFDGEERLDSAEESISFLRKIVAKKSPHFWVIQFDFLVTIYFTDLRSSSRKYLNSKRGGACAENQDISSTPTKI